MKVEIRKWEEKAVTCFSRRWECGYLIAVLEDFGKRTLVCQTPRSRYQLKELAFLKYFLCAHS